MAPGRVTPKEPSHLVQPKELGILGRDGNEVVSMIIDVAFRRRVEISRPNSLVERPKRLQVRAVKTHEALPDAASVALASFPSNQYTWPPFPITLNPKGSTFRNSMGHADLHRNPRN
jgi:hypothetical protein